MTDSQQDLLLALAASPDFRKDKLVFAGRHSGLYRSRDGGRSWELQSIIAGETLSVTALAFSPDFVNNRTVFAAMPGGVAYSQDAGSSWFWSRLPTPPPFISTLAVSPNFKEDKTIFAGTLEDGVLSSTDGGVSWQAWNFGLLDKQVLCLALDREKIYAGTGTGLFCSRNGGRAWLEVNLPVEDSVLSLAMMEVRLLVGTEAHGLFTSTDGGRSWRRIKTTGLGSPINQIQASAGKEPSIRILAGGGRLLESFDDVKTWRAIQLPIGDEPILLAGPLTGYASGQITGF